MPEIGAFAVIGGYGLFVRVCLLKFDLEWSLMRYILNITMNGVDDDIKHQKKQIARPH